MAHRRVFSRTALGALWLCGVAAVFPLSAQAEAAPPPAAASAAAVQAPSPGAPTQATLAPIVVTGRSPVPASVAGFDDTPLAETPLQATAIDAALIRDAGARRLADLVRFDAAVGDAYNSEGYIDYFTVRGFVIDNRFNFRRDGLPINAETSIPLDNKARVDILKGLSGMQVGTSAPGGLVDLVVKRPLDAPLRSAFVEVRQHGSILGSVDLSQRFGNNGVFGLRLNAAAEHIDPQVRDTAGHRTLLAVAGDWRAGTNTLLEAEIETSHRAQPSQAAFSLLGDRVPAVADPRLNLNHQPWTLPVVFDATTASLRLTQKIAADWRVVAQAMSQHLRTDDREAFPFGCSDPGPPATYYAHSFCPNGTFDLYDFRSENERRHSSTFDLGLHGALATGALRHAFVGGVQRTLVRNRFQDAAFNPVGSGNIDGTVVDPPDSTPTSPNTDRDERSTELYLRDAIAIGARAKLWLGLRHTQLTRSTMSTQPSSDSPGTRYRQSITTPFAAVSYAFAPGQLAYASYGQGAQSDVAPTNAIASASGGAAGPLFSNSGQALPAARSRQFEVGLKGGFAHLEGAVAAFDIRQPLFGDIGSCDAPAACTRTLLGTQRHRGLEANASWLGGAWRLRGGLQWLHARVETPLDPSQDGKRPTNVPALSARAEASYALPMLSGVAVALAGHYDSGRQVTLDNSVAIPSVTRFDLAARQSFRAADVAWTLRAGIDNLLDRRAWREAPYQFDHAYLFPLAPRTARVSLEAAL